MAKPATDPFVVPPAHVTDGACSTRAVAPRPERDAGIETLRGLAVVLMVAGHVIGNNAQRGLGVPDDSGWRYFYFTLLPLRMPLFTAISGFVYALRPAADWPRFVEGKARRLLVPLVVVGSVFLAIQAAVTEHTFSLADIPRLLVFPREHFWYLHALMWIFLLVGALDTFGLLRRGWQVLLLMTLPAPLLAFDVVSTPVLGIWHALNLLPYFLVGVAVRRFPAWPPRPVVVALAGLGVLGLARHQAWWFGWAWSSDAEAHAVHTLVGVIAVAACLACRRTCRPLARLGGYAYGIYLLHVFGTAGSRIALRRAGIESLPLLAIAGLLAGIAVPIAIERALGGNSFLAPLVLGRRARAREAAPAAPGAPVA